MIFKVNHSGIQCQTCGDVVSSGLSNLLDGMFGSILKFIVFLFYVLADIWV